MQHTAMMPRPDDSRMHRHLIDSIYVEAMVLADESRSYFDEEGRADREPLSPLARVAFSCESLKVTTRLMHVIAWLLVQRAVASGELRAGDALDPSRRLGEAPQTAAATAATLPLRAQALVEASIELHRRVTWLDTAQGRTAAPASPPVHGLQQRLALAF